MIWKKLYIKQYFSLSKINCWNVGLSKTVKQKSFYEDCAKDHLKFHYSGQSVLWFPLAHSHTPELSIQEVTVWQWKYSCDS